MRILATADLHYDIARSRPGTEHLARRASATGGDALVLVGDCAGADLAVFSQCLHLFDAFRGAKFVVPGNHCLWCRGDENSLDRYERLIPQAATQCGFAVLDHAPAVVGGVGLVGSIGWYDYSFRDEGLAIPLPFYRAKMAPGAARYLQRHLDLLEAHRTNLSERHLAMGARWMDGEHVRLTMTDEQFVDLLAGRLARQLEEMSQRVDIIAAFVHHLPFHELVPRDRPGPFAFAAAYMGSPAIGAVLRRFPKVRHVLCGHSHWPGRYRVEQLDVVNIGSTYVEKRLEILDL